MDPEVSIVLEEGAFAPEYQTDGAAGMDLRLYEDVRLEPMERKLARTGIRIAVPAGFEAQVRPRSGMALKHGVTMANTPGTIDSDYRGEVQLILVNLGGEAVTLAKGDRVAQMVIAPVAHATLRVASSLDETERGGGGFGSTGKR